MNRIFHFGLKPNPVNLVNPVQISLRVFSCPFVDKRSLVLISTYLNIALLIVAVLCGAALFAGMQLGRSSQRGAAIDRNAVIFSVALLVLFVGGTVPLAQKNGWLVTAIAFCFGAAIGVGLLGGLIGGRRMQKGQPVWGIPMFLTLLLIAVLLGWVNREVKIIAGAARELGLDSPQTAKIDPVADKDCPENLKSLYLAFEKYVEQDGSLPKANWLDDSDLTGKIVKDEWEHCPAVSNRHDDKFGYAYNVALAGMSLGGKEKLKDLPKASETPLLYDSTHLAKNAADAVTSLPKPGRHNGANYILYLDGTIKSVR